MATAGENPMRTITVDQIFDELRFGTGGKFFSVTFHRRTALRHGVNLGDARTMLCRTGVQMGTKGVIPQEERDEEDFRCAVLTVCDVTAYRKYRRRGWEQNRAAERSFRRIDLTTITECSVLDEKTDLPPFLVAEFHQI